MANPGERIRKLVMLATGDDNEARSAAAKARKQLAELDTELLDTLAGQRKHLLEDLHEEFRRLMNARERATKAETGELVDRAMLLFGHYERIDALIPAVMLLRIESGHRLTDEERQQLDGPVESILDRWNRSARERRKADREERRAAKRAKG